MGWYLDRKCSCKRIDSTIRELGINTDEAIVPPGGYASFNDFFARKLKDGARPLPADACKLISPADCRLTVYPQINGDTVIPVKGTPYTTSELLGADAEGFTDGALMVCRLCPADYHRYHTPDAGTVLSSRKVRGKYHSVNPLALEAGCCVFTQNLRVVVMLDLAHAGRCAFVPVGAFGVASIHNCLAQPGMQFARGDEAGYFTFGGSTVIMVFPKDSVLFDADIVEHSAQGVETLVKANSAIGTYLRG
jgi:phosphatidylserine decarboxylase